MTLSDWLTVASAASYLAIALLAAMRRAKHPLAVELGLMCVGLFAYNMFELLSNVVPAAPWVPLSDAVASLLAVPTLELFLGFMGLSRRFTAARRVGRLYFGVLAAAALSTAGPRWVGRSTWASLMLVGVVGLFGAVGLLLSRYTRRATGVERTRAQLLLGALLLGIGGVISDLGALAGAPLPRLSYVGLLGAALLIAAVTLRARIVEGASIATLINASIVAVAAVVALVALGSWAGDRPALLAVGALVLLLVVGATLGPVVTSYTRERERGRYLATLGRFSQQLAHDLRNPLAAIQGAAQFLLEERRAGRTMDEHEDFVQLILERAARVERLIQDYQRMGRIELARAPVDVNALLADAARGFTTSAPHAGANEPPALHLTLEPGAGLPTLSLDPDLFAFAIENLLRNASEAMPSGGTITLRSEPAEGRYRGGVRVVVADTGVGMDVRLLDRAHDEFFTTKAGGSGLGLAFVRRVVAAHDGRVTMESEEGVGTRVVVDLPAYG